MTILKKLTAGMLISMMFVGAISSTAYAKKAQEDGGKDSRVTRTHS